MVYQNKFFSLERTIGMTSLKDPALLSNKVPRLHAMARGIVFVGYESVEKDKL